MVLSSEAVTDWFLFGLLCNDLKYVKVWSTQESGEALSSLEQFVKCARSWCCVALCGCTALHTTTPSHTHAHTHPAQHPIHPSAFSSSYIRASIHAYQRTDLSVFSPHSSFCPPPPTSPVYISRQCCLESFPWQRTVAKQHKCLIFDVMGGSTTGVNESEAPSSAKCQSCFFLCWIHPESFLFLKNTKKGCTSWSRYVRENRSVNHKVGSQ